MLTIKDFTRVNSDVNGNPRYVLHFTLLGNTYLEALNNSRQFGGKKYNTKSYGGGIVFQTYSLDSLTDKINNFLENNNNGN